MQYMNIFQKKDADEDDEEVIKVAVIGKPNVGKSSLINKIFGEKIEQL